MDAFKLPSRIIAKKFVFRLIYGGSEYSYARDPDFTDVSTNEKFWKEVIERFYTKYYGWSNWHILLMHEATTTGKLVMPTGREYTYKLTDRGDWPRTTILNYPVQGLGADLMAIIRVAFKKRFLSRGFVGKIVASVHDSIVVDCPVSEINRVALLFEEVFNEAPMLFEKWFGKKFTLPMRCEISYGPNMYDLTEWRNNANPN